MLNMFRVKYYDRSNQAVLFFVRNDSISTKESEFYSTQIKKVW